MRDKFIAKAQGLVFRMFAKITDKNGEPYHQHCFNVAEEALVQRRDEDLYCVGLLHDIIEDTPMEMSDLIELGFSERITNAVESMTRREDEAYTDYIHRLSGNPDAIVVKLCDLKHNTDPSRFCASKLGEDTYNRLRKKYFWAMDYLQNLESML